MLPTSLIGLILLRATLSSAQLDTCYHPDGSVSKADTPCNSSAEVSACCYQDHLCTSNGLCFGDGGLHRGSCTDSDWESEECSQLCQTCNRAGGCPITWCNPGGDPQTWACGVGDDSQERCSSGNTFVLRGDLAAVFLRPEQASVLGFPNGLDIGPSTSLTPNITTTQNDTVTCPSFSATTQPENTGYTAAQMAGVGAGVGVPLLLALVAALAYIAKLRKQHHYVPAAAAAWSTREPQRDWEEQKKVETVSQPYEVDGRERLPELHS